VSTLALVPRDNTPVLTDLASLTVLSLASPSSRRNYSREIRRFILSGRPLNREGILAHLASIRESGAGPVSRNIALAAVRLFAREAHARGDLAESVLMSIERIKGDRLLGTRAGNWLTIAQIRRLIDQAGEGRNGPRNQAIITCMAGCGLRRGEIAQVRWDQWQQRDGRWCWVDLVGKGGRVRTVPCPDWAAGYVTRWQIIQSSAHSIHGLPAAAYGRGSERGNGSECATTDD
jgi:integrase/recombinase XerD